MNRKYWEINTKGRKVTSESKPFLSEGLLSSHLSLDFACLWHTNTLLLPPTMTMADNMRHTHLCTDRIHGGNQWKEKARLTERSLCSISCCADSFSVPGFTLPASLSASLAYDSQPSLLSCLSVSEQYSLQHSSQYSSQHSLHSILLLLLLWFVLRHKDLHSVFVLRRRLISLLVSRTVLSIVLILQLPIVPSSLSPLDTFLLS